MVKISQAELDFLLSLLTNSTYDELTIIGSSCQHIHKPRLTNEEYSWILHSITFTSLLFNLFSMYTILTQTSVSMGRFRWCLLNLQIWTAITDWMIAGFSVPRFALPLIAGRALGLFTSLGMSIPMQIYIGFGCFGAMVASTAVLFFYRHQVIVGADHYLKLKRSTLFLILAGNYLLYTNMSLTVLATGPDNQLNTKLELLRVERCPPKDILHPDFYVGLVSHDLLPFGIFLLGFVGSECGFLSLHSSWILFFSTLRANFSRRTRILQIKFLVALLLQIAIPTALCYFPIFYALITIVLDHHWQFANDICVFVCSTHGTVSSICVLLLYDCYRDYLFYLIKCVFCCCCGRPRPHHVGENIISPSRSDNTQNSIHRPYIT